MAMRRQRNELQARLAQVEARRHAEQAGSSVASPPRSVTSARTVSSTYTSKSAQLPSSDSLHVSLFDAMATLSDRDASMLLAQLRTGQSWEEVAREVQSRASGDGEQSASHDTLHEATSILADDLLSDLNDLDRESSLPRLFSREDWQRLHDLSLQYGSHALAELQGHIHISSHFMRSIGDSLPLDQTAELDRKAESQNDKLRVPVWAVLPLTDDGAVNEPFQAAFQHARAEFCLQDDPEDYCGSHLWLEALYDEGTYARAPRLSKVIADLARSVRPEPWADIVTTYSLMWHYW